MGLDLVKCSDKFEHISLSSMVRITKRKGKNKNKWFEKYIKRPNNMCHMTFHEFFHDWKQQKKGQRKKEWIIPHYTGSNTIPVYPPTKQYVRYIFLVHKPWTGTFNFDPVDWETDYKDYMNSNKCPDPAVMQYIQAMQRHLSRTQNMEITDKPGTVNEHIDSDTEELLALASMHARKSKNDIDGESVFDFGLNYDWEIDYIERNDIKDGSTWLDDEIHKRKQCSESLLDLPYKIDSNGVLYHYEIEDLTNDQKDVMAYVLYELKKWVNKDPSFKTIQLTIRGKGGTGKTVLLKTITSTIRRMFKSNTAVKIGGPTGASSCNAGGCTDNYLFAVTEENKFTMNVQDAIRSRLYPEFKDTIALLLDERSMRESKMLARMEVTARYCAHGGNRTQDLWGGIPIVIQFGDDYQLPSVGKGVLYIPLPGHYDIRTATEYNSMTLAGHELFLQFAENVMELPVIKRQDSSELDMLSRLQRTRTDDLNEDDVTYFQSLHLDNLKKSGLTDSEISDIKKKSLWVYANNAPKDEHNIESLHIISSIKNKPVARIVSKFAGGNKRLNRPMKSHFRNRKSPNISLFCIGAKVCICGRNIMPEWGLHNGAIGTVIEIRFNNSIDKNKKPNPNNGDLPIYVVIDLPTYTGPIWDKLNPTHVPIPLCRERCEKGGCCTKEFIPLITCFATTIHRNQGLQVGPTKQHQKPNAAEIMILDPGNKKMEHNNIGTFYTGYSRATTDGNGDIKKSAIYFTGENITKERLMGMTTYKYKPDEEIIWIKRRNAWIELLERNTHTSNLSHEQKEILFDWATSTTYSKQWIINHTRSFKYSSCVL